MNKLRLLNLIISSIAISISITMLWNILAGVTIGGALFITAFFLTRYLEEVVSKW